MKLFVTLTRRSLAAVLFAVILFILLSVRFLSVGPQNPGGSTNALRMSYIESLGLSADDSFASAEEITVPQSFSEIYTEYNKLQKRAGFDLSDYKGKKVTLYTYPFGDGGVKQIHLLVYNGYIIGGDIDSFETDSEMKPLMPI